MNSKRLRRRLTQDFGRPPEETYRPGDMESIRAWYDLQARQDGAFHVDETTWNDLDMDRVYQRVNKALCTSGEQWLYCALRTPALEEGEWKARAAFARDMGEHPQARLKAQEILWRLGRPRRADLCRAVQGERRGRARLILFLLLGALLPALLLLLPVLGKWGLLALVACAGLNNLVHEVCRRGREGDYDTVNYAAAMVRSAEKLRRMKEPVLDRHLEKAYEALTQLKAVLRVGGVSAFACDSVTGALGSALLLDLIAYEYLKDRLDQNRAALIQVHEALGRLDVAVMTASWRAGMEVWCEPELTFGGRQAFFEAEGLAHPLLKEPVRSDLNARRSVLITGSNASGKSTFLRSVGLCALLGQSLCTCPARRYRGAAMRLATSMALRDDVTGGESYYIVETRSLKRIVDMTGAPPVLCLVDEVLRGTNTVERIAASTQVLSELSAGGALCLAATHDRELCGLLREAFDQYHFEEQMDEDGMHFDYRLREGPATSRNALRLLAAMGFGRALVERAEAMAGEYEETGVWRA